jgi:hypothetical protein
MARLYENDITDFVCQKPLVTALSRRTDMSKRLLLSFVIGALALGGCGGQPAATGAPAGQSASLASSGQAPQKRTFYLAAVEWKSSSTVSNNPFPTAKLPEGDGYELIEPDANGTWVVETYHLTPALVVVNQGDTVTLEIIGINGKQHPLKVEGYNVSGVVKRGEVTRITFTADKAGIFMITSSSKPPTMQAELVVLPGG